MSTGVEPDVIIVGLGASGGIIARELSQAGFKVLGLEKGGGFEHSDGWQKFDELRYESRAEQSPRMDDNPITWRAEADQQAVVAPWAVGPLLNPFTIPPSSGLGGGSMHYAAWHFRQYAEDFNMRSVIVERYGERGLPEGSHIKDWPVGYEELEPYYVRVEREVGVSGIAGNIKGQLMEGGNPFETPRSGEFPFPPVRSSALYGEFAAASASLGYHPYQTPTAIISEDSGQRKACTSCGFCRDYLCHVGAKSSTHVTIIPEAVRTGNLEIRERCRVQRLLVGSDGRAAGVAYLDLETNEVKEVRAPRVILAAYVLENVRLLLASGINRNGQTGKYYFIHKYDFIWGTMPDDARSYMGPVAAGGAIDDFNAQNKDWSDTEDVVWGGPLLLFNGDVQPIEGASSVPPDVAPWGPEFKQWLTSGYRRMFGIVSIGVQFPMDCNYLDLDPELKDPWGQPALRMTHKWTRHEEAFGNFAQERMNEIAEGMGADKTWTLDMTPFHITTHDHGGHIMGDDPNDSVVNSYQESHEVPGLFVVGGGSFPTVSGYNPTATIQALAFRTADHIIESAASTRLGNGHE